MKAHSHEEYPNTYDIRSKCALALVPALFFFPLLSLELDHDCSLFETKAGSEAVGELYFPYLPVFIRPCDPGFKPIHETPPYFNIQRINRKSFGSGISPLTVSASAVFLFIGKANSVKF